MTGNADRIDILLATYNGAKYLPEQLASIEAQSHANWHLVARDDGSSDGTPAILEAFRARHPERVTILNDADGNLGLVQNFSRLMEASTGPYAALCDQDDVWLPDKLALTLAKMRALESEHGPDTPLLVFTDLEVVDEELWVVGPSYWCYQGLDANRARAFNSLLSQNVVTGCTVLMNRTLRSLASPIPDAAMVHDWWLALVAAAFGRAEPFDSATVRYRQHGLNRLGARPYHLLALLGRAMSILRDWPKERATIRGRFTQAAAFSSRFDGRLGAAEIAALQAFRDLPRRSLLGRIRATRRYGFAPRGTVRMAYFMLCSDR